MLTVYSNDHQLHRGRFELSGGELVPCFECPERADLVFAAVQEAALGNIVAPLDFGLEPILRVHEPRFVQFLQDAWALWTASGRVCDALPYSWAVRGMHAQEPENIDGKLAYFSFDATSPITGGTWQAVKSSANTALGGAAALLGGERCVFSLCRPPGHHAAADYFGGYCYLNNAAIAAQYLRDKGASKVAILDVDYHHGNGTQSIFYARDDVLFTSIHGDPDQEFPFFLGRSDETGSGAGRGYNANFPLRWQSSVASWFAALDQVITLIRDYAPDYVVVSLGVDTFMDDPISQFCLGNDDYLTMGARIAALNLPMQFILEGGYAVGDIGVNVANVLRAATTGSAGRVIQGIKTTGWWAGIALAVAVATLSVHAADWFGVALLKFPHSPVSAIMMAIVIGMLVTNTVRLPQAWRPGLTFCTTAILRIGIMLLGIRLSLLSAGQFTLVALPFVLVAITVGLLTVAMIGKKMGLSRQLSGLIAVGTSICGCTAIVATAPLIDANEAEVSYSVACITLFGLAAMFFYPLLAHYAFAGQPELAGLFLGTSIHETAQVAGAGMMYEAQYNAPVALELATVTKLVRNLCMIAVIPIVGILYGSKGRGNGDKVNYLAMIPWFIVGFALMSALRTIGDSSEHPFGLLEPAQWDTAVRMLRDGAEYCLLIAMAAVGLTSMFAGIRSIGLRPFALGLFAAVLVGGLSFGLIAMFAGRVMALLGLITLPLVAHNDLPTFEVLRQRGQTVLSLERAREQDIRELHIGLLNMMPDAALAATERQFIRLVGSSNPIAQFYVYPFSIPELARSAAAEEHIRKHYFAFDQLAADGLDALIITGANVINPSLDQEAFWDPLIDIVRWADDNVASIFCSCLATHALVKHYHGLNRQHLGEKQWGVYKHRLTDLNHPLLRDVNTRFDAPHSRYNDISRAQFESAGMHVLAESADVGVHLAVSPDQCRVVYFQGHPEYSAISLLKECKREIHRYIAGERTKRPRVPENYLTPHGEQIANAHIEAVLQAVADGTTAPEFPEQALAAEASNTWGDTGKAIVNNWLGLVYQLTNLDRHKQFMPDVDPADPLGLNANP